MKNYYIKRVVSALVTTFVVATITFFLMRAIPGGPFTREKPLPPEIVAALEAKYNLDKPLMLQYLDYMKGLLTGDLGPSFKRIGYSVNQLISEGFPTSMQIGGGAVVVIIAIGIPVGIISALKQGKTIDYIVMLLATLGVTIPSFVVATLIVYFFAGKWGILPSFGNEQPLWYVGPVIALSGYSLSFVARLTRSSMLEVLRQDYVRTARANGIPEYKVIFKHALKNAMIPVVTYIGPMIAAILTGSFVIEKIFSLPGIGRYFVESVGNRDYTVIMGTTIVYAMFYIVMVLIVDILYPLIDPRIKMEG